MNRPALDYAFPHSAADESRRLELFEGRLDPLTIQRIESLSLAPTPRCLEIGAGHGSITRWLCTHAGSEGHVTATDVQTEFLSRLSAPNLSVQCHDVRTDPMPHGGPFELIHLRAVLMHLDHRMQVLRRVASWLAPGGWLLVEEPDFGMWLSDADPVWSAHPRAWHEAFPAGSLMQGRALLRQIHDLDLEDIGADAELDIVRPNTPLAEFYELSMAALAEPSIASGILTPEEANALIERPRDPHFHGCGFAHIGVWGRRSMLTRQA